MRGAIVAEQRLLEPEVRRDPAAVCELLDDDFTEIGQTGVAWTRAEVMTALVSGSANADDDIEASGWTVREVGPELALVGFETRRGGILVQRTTLWRRRDGAWRAVAHHGTRVVS